MRITESQRNLLVKLDEQPPLDHLKGLFQTMSPRDQGLMQHSLFLGVVMDELLDTPQQGDFLIRNVVGMDASTGVLAIGELLKEGQLVQFHLRDAETSSEDLTAVLERYAMDNRENQVHGALLFSCLGRGNTCTAVPTTTPTSSMRNWGRCPWAVSSAMGRSGPSAEPLSYTVTLAPSGFFGPDIRPGGLQRRMKIGPLCLVALRACHFGKLCAGSECHRRAYGEWWVAFDPLMVSLSNHHPKPVEGRRSRLNSYGLTQQMASPRLLKVGIPASLSGQFQVQGKQALAGLQSWADDVNRSCGIAFGCPGVRTKVSVIHHDDSSNPEQAKQITDRLITQDRVDLLFGPYSSVLSQAAAQVAESHHRLIWNQGGASDGIYQQGYRWIVGILTPASQYLAGLIPLVRKAHPETVTVGMLSAYPGAFPRMIITEVERQADLLGFEVVYTRQYPPSLTDFSNILEEIRAVGPQVLVAVGRISNDLKFVQALVQKPLNLRAVAVVAAPIQQFRDALGMTWRDSSVPASGSPRACTVMITDRPPTRSWLR